MVHFAERTERARKDFQEKAALRSGDVTERCMLESTHRFRPGAEHRGGKESSKGSRRAGGERLRTGFLMNKEGRLQLPGRKWRQLSQQ